MDNKKILFKGKLISLVTKKMRLPNGYLANLEIIRHPGAVLVIPFLSEDKIILLKQFRPVINSYLYELPAGTLKKNESLFSCAKREIIEETGYAATSLKKIGLIYPVPGYSTERIIIYQARGLKKKKGAFDKDEIIESFAVTKKQLKQMFRQGKITDSKTISALAICGWLRD